LTFLLSLAAHAADYTTTYRLTGAWWERKAAPGYVISAGEMRIWLYSDGVAQAEREFDDGIFDLCDGTWSEKRNRFGVVTSVSMRFVSDFAGELFKITAKKGVAKGKFNSAAGYAGTVQAAFTALETNSLTHTSTKSARPPAH
jgi:hypothetical protein